MNALEYKGVPTFFGEGWFFIAEPARLICDAMRNNASIWESRMTVHREYVDGAHFISAELLGKIVALSQAEKHGVPIDEAVVAWCFAHGIGLDFYTQSGVPRMRPDDWRIAIRFDDTAEVAA